MSLSIFVSYAHESQEFRNNVRELVNELKKCNFSVTSDFDHEDSPPDIGWQMWMHHGIEDSDIVLVICSPYLIKRYHKREDENIGLGATYEGAIVLQYLYDAAQKNSKFYPILHDSGSISDIPTILKPFYNGLKFPSGLDGISRLVNSKRKLDLDSNTLDLDEYAYDSGRISGIYDSRIMPTERKVYGRDEEIKEVLNFLNDDAPELGNVCHIVGVGGIGKTELCKAALRLWFKQNSTNSAYYIDVPDNADETELISRIGEVHGRRDALYFEEVSVLLKPCLYYLDNLESIAELQNGKKILREMSRISGLRLLASSRVPLPKDFGKPIKLKGLPVEASIALFTSAWAGESLTKSEERSLGDFVSKDLGGHCLTISITARLGDCYSFSSLVERWNSSNQLDISDYTDGVSREENLYFSLGLTADALKETKGALNLWTFVSIFPKGVFESVVAQYECDADIPSAARRALSRHNILFMREGKFFMLPPIARFSLDRAKRERDGFSWSSIRPFTLSKIRGSKETSINADSMFSPEGGVAARILELESESSDMVKGIMDVSKNFIANTTHELRTPLAVIEGYTEMMNSELGKKESHPYYAHTEKMLIQIERMQHTLRNLFQLARVDSDIAQKSCSWIQLDGLLKELLSDVELLSNRCHRIKFPSSTHIELFVDREGIYHALSALLINAIENTQEKGWIDFNVKILNNKKLRIAIADNGAGISPEHISRVTERFYRVVRSRLGSNNSGLGLSIVREFNCKYNCELIIESKVNVGSTFSLILPLKMYRKISDSDL